MNYEISFNYKNMVLNSHLCLNHELLLSKYVLLLLIKRTGILMFPLLNYSFHVWMVWKVLHVLMLLPFSMVFIRVQRDEFSSCFDKNYEWEMSLTKLFYWFIEHYYLTFILFHGGQGLMEHKRLNRKYKMTLWLASLSMTILNLKSPFKNNQFSERLLF